MIKQLLYLFCLVFCSQFAAAEILNGSFEQVDSNDSNLPVFWQIDRGGVLPEIRRSYSTLEEPYKSNNEVNLMPMDGQHFLLLRSDNAGRRPLIDSNYSQISQNITVTAGERLSGAYFFSTGDYIPYYDTGTIKLVPDSGSNSANLHEILLAEKSVSDVGNYQTMLNWETFVHDFNDAEAGNYTLILQITDAFDRLFTSHLAVDALKLCYMPSGDINSDCRVDVNDLQPLMTQWLNSCDANSGWCGKTDLNQSGSVDLVDFAIFANNWLIDCSALPLDPACAPKQ
jgi:hypothetical protein